MPGPHLLRASPAAHSLYRGAMSPNLLAQEAALAWGGNMDSRACACPCPLGTGCIEASSQFQFRSGGLSRLTDTDSARGLRAARANTSSCSFDRLGFSTCLVMVQAATLRWELELPTHPTIRPCRRKSL